MGWFPQGQQTDALREEALSYSSTRSCASASPWRKIRSCCPHRNSTGQSRRHTIFSLTCLWLGLWLAWPPWGEGRVRKQAARLPYPPVCTALQALRILRKIFVVIGIFFSIVFPFHFPLSHHHLYIHIHTRNLHMRSEKPGSRLVGSGLLFSLLFIVPFPAGGMDGGREGVTQSTIIINHQQYSFHVYSSLSLSLFHSFIYRGVFRYQAQETGGSIFRGSGSGREGGQEHLFDLRLIF